MPLVGGKWIIPGAALPTPPHDLPEKVEPQMHRVSFTTSYKASPDNTWVPVSGPSAIRDSGLLLETFNT